MVKVGSRVKFISDTGAGIVRSIKGNLAYVEVDGFEIPALLSDIVEVELEQENAAIVRIGPDDPKVKPSQTGPKAAPGTVKIAPNRGVGQYGKISISQEWEDEETIDIDRIKQNYKKQTQAQIQTQHQELSKVVEKAPFEVTDFDLKLVFVPVNVKDKPAHEADLQMYIVNDSSYQVYYNVAQWASGYVTTIKGGLLDSDTKEALKLFSRVSLSQLTTLHISILPFKSTSYVPQGVENFDIELHPLKFVRSGNYQENEFFDQPSVVFTLATTSLEIQPNVMTVEAVGQVPLKSQDKPKIIKAKVQPDREVVDLHVEAFLDGAEQMNNAQILEAQLARFTIALDGAIASGEHLKMVFIHGVGKGKLKYEMKKLLDRKYSKFRYQDASFAEYGYGAIMVFV